MGRATYKFWLAGRRSFSQEDAPGILKVLTHVAIETHMGYIVKQLPLVTAALEEQLLVAPTIERIQEMRRTLSWLFWPIGYYLHLQLRHHAETQLAELVQLYMDGYMVASTEGQEDMRPIFEKYEQALLRWLTYVIKTRGYFVEIYGLSKREKTAGSMDSLFVVAAPEEQDSEADETPTKED